MALCKYPPGMNVADGISPCHYVACVRCVVWTWMRPSLACSTSRQSNATRSTTTRLRTGKDAPANLLSCRQQPLPQPPSGTFPDYLCHHSKPPAENWSLLVTRQILDPSWFDIQIPLYLNTNVSVIWSVFLFTQNIFNFWLPLLGDYPIFIK